MPFCEKCGGQITEEMKFCDKCGAPVAAENVSNPEPVVQEDAMQNVENNEVSQRDTVVVMQNAASVDVKAKAEGLFDTIKSYLPENLKTPGDKTLHWIGFGSLAALALTYVICFFIFMNEMCFPIGIGASYGGNSIAGLFGVDGASPVWMIVYFALNLFPVYFAVKAFKYESSKKGAVVAVGVSFILTIFTLIVWGICDLESIDGANSMAWYFLNDSLSAAWYLKFILPVVTFLGFGLDYIINKKN